MAEANLDELRRKALETARGLSDEESALAGVLRDLEQERSRAAQALHAVLGSLAAALEARDGYTGAHSDDVRDLAVAVAGRLGLDARATGEVEAVALLHDIGKIGIPDRVLHKAGPLDAGEWALMRRHPEIGEHILRPLPGLGGVAKAVRHEHERWDGGGYPDGLGGTDIPLASRIVLACDAYHALVSDRPYRAARSADEARAELRACAGTQFDPQVIDALLACLDAPGGVRPRPSGAEDVARALVAPDEEVAGDRPARELHALIAIASAVGAAHRVEDVVEVAADEACAAIGAASVSISRWEVERRVLRTLVNAGELGPGEERSPANETYRMEDDELLRRLIERGESYTMSLGDDDIDPLERRLLEDLGKAHCVGVGITFAGGAWGELWATRTAEQGRFEARDVRFLHTVAGQIGAAVGRTETFSRMAELAFEDPLTGVANRRALDERLELAVADALDAGRDLAILLCDLDNLKELNDLHGHQAGDRALVAVARVLAEEAAVHGHTLVARVGGDEFAVLLDGVDAEQSRGLGHRVLERLGALDGAPLTVSCGVASLALGARRAGDLLRAADAAQYTAKRSGRARVRVAEADMDAAWRANSAERRAVRGRAAETTIDVGILLAAGLDALDDRAAGRDPLDRLESVGLVAAEAVDATALALSRRLPGGDVVSTMFVSDRRTDRTAGTRFGTGSEDYALDEYPTTAELLRRGGSMLVRADDPQADPAERELLADFGMSAVLVIGVPDAAGGGWLVEVFADARTGELCGIEPALRLLAGEAVRGAAVPARA